MPHRIQSAYHPWLVDQNNMGTPFLVIDTGDDAIPRCARAVAEHLNEFDDASGSPWIAIDDTLLKAIAIDPHQRRMLGVQDPCPRCPPTGPCGIRKVIEAIAKRGRFVLNHHAAQQALQENQRAFRACIAPPEREVSSYHLILNPGAFPEDCLAPLIADSYLEWAAAEQVA